MAQNGKATLERRRKSASHKLITEKDDRLARVAKVFSFALKIYEHPDRAREFMIRPHERKARVAESGLY